MSFFLLLNPKQFIDPGWVGIGEELLKRRSKEVEEAEIIAKKALEMRPPRTEQLDSKVSQFIGLSNKLLALDNEYEQLLREEIAREIVRMEEEENILLLMLLH